MAEVQLFNVRFGLPSDYYYAIGAVATKWALLEHCMSTIAKDAAALDNKSARCLMGGMTAGTLGSTLKNLATLHITDHQLRDDVIAYQSSVRKLEDRRNEFVHCVWGTPAGADEPLTLLIARSAAQRLMPDGEPLTANEVIVFAHDLHLLALAGNTLMDRVAAWRKAQPPASQAQTGASEYAPARSLEETPLPPPPSQE